jgi:hypothetical protein
MDCSLILCLDTLQTAKRLATLRDICHSVRKEKKFWDTSASVSFLQKWYVIIRHELDLNRSVAALSIDSSKGVQVVFILAVYNSALLLSSCCCSFLLHVVANLIRIFLVSRQLFLLSALAKFLPNFLEEWKVTN